MTKNSFLFFLPFLKICFSEFAAKPFRLKRSATDDNPIQSVAGNTSLGHGRALDLPGISTRTRPRFHPGPERDPPCTLAEPCSCTLRKAPPSRSGRELRPLHFAPPKEKIIPSRGMIFSFGHFVHLLLFLLFSRLMFLTASYGVGSQFPYSFLTFSISSFRFLFCLCLSLFFIFSSTLN